MKWVLSGLRAKIVSNSDFGARRLCFRQGHNDREREREWWLRITNKNESVELWTGVCIWKCGTTSPARRQPVARHHFCTRPIRYSSYIWSGYILTLARDWFNESTNHGAMIPRLWWVVKSLRHVWGLVHTCHWTASAPTSSLYLVNFNLGISKRVQDTCFVRARSIIIGKANRRRQLRGYGVRIKFLLYCWWSNRVWLMCWLHTQSKRRQRWKTWWTGVWTVTMLIGWPDNVEGMGRRSVGISPHSLLVSNCVANRLYPIPGQM